jgi:hypothetical protein
MGVSGLESLVCECSKPVILTFGFKPNTGETVVLKLESPVKPALSLGFEEPKIPSSGQYAQLIHRLWLGFQQVPANQLINS